MTDTTRHGPIEVGDIVDVVYNGEFDYSIMAATVINVPRGEGDMFEVSVDGISYAINPYNHTLMYIRRVVDTALRASDGDAADTEGE